MNFLKQAFFLGVLSFGVLGAASATFAQSYPYNYYYVPPAQQPLSCSASVAQVQAGESVTFYASGGFGTVYNWTTPLRTYLNIGPQLTVSFATPGTQTVTVSSGAQAASCTVFVTASPTTPSSYNPQSYNYPVTYFTAQYIPGLPNTGFAPITAASVGFAVVLLIVAGLFVSPYVKRTLASTFR